MANVFASSTVGQLLHWASRGQLLRYPEQEEDFKLPSRPTSSSGLPVNNSSQNDSPEQGSPGGVLQDTEATAGAGEPDEPSNYTTSQLPGSSESLILVDWYGKDDPENPQNWSFLVKAMVFLQINLYTFTVYMSSSIFSSTAPYFMEYYGTTQAVTSLGLALYVLGYGVAPMLFSPLSEVPSIGRNPPYVITFSIYVILTIPTALVRNVPGFMVLRFLQGFFGSPCLSTGGASIADITSLMYIPYGLFVWAIASLAAPALAPTIAGFTVMNEGWRWPMWEIFWCTAPCLIFLFFLPETSAPTILLRRARRLRAATGNPNFKSQSEIDQEHLHFTEVAKTALITPWKVNALDPAILFTTIYTALTYAIFYSFFEVFPLVYQEIYGMSPGELGLVFLTSIIGTLVVLPFYFFFIHYFVNRPMRQGNFPPPERRLIPALFASLLLPTGLFLFAWTSRESIHWVVPTVGFLFTMMAICLIVQCLFTYIGIAYTKYAASLFAMNGLVRSGLAFASVLWSGPLYENLGVGRGTSLIGGLTVGCVFGIFTLYFCGPALRKRSRFTD